MKPGSDVANLSVLGYDPKIYYTGRSPLEAGSIGIDMKKTDVSLRCNLVTVTDEPEYSDKTIVDYCADDISTEEAAILIKYLAENLDNDEFKFYSGVSYRHCLIWNNGTLDIGTITPPHDITGKPVKNYVPAHPNAAKLYDLMKKSYDLLKDHPVNKAREERGLRPANSIWLWGEGVRANLDDFKGKYGLNGSMISAVDLLKGIGKFSNMRVVNYGTIFVTLSDMTKEEALPLIKRFYDLGFNIEATSGTGKFLKEHGIRTRIKKKLNQGSTEILDSLRKGHIAYVINTPGIDETIHTDGYLIRRVAIENNVPLFTSLYTVGALLNVLDEITMKVGMI